MKSVFLAVSLQALVASASHSDILSLASNSTEALRNLRGKGMMGMGGGMGMGRGGSGGSGRMEMMQIIHNLLANGDKIEREVTENDRGISSYTHSPNTQVSGWINKQ
jgi:hypothetical protein